jgi:hypothetical protein
LEIVGAEVTGKLSVPTCGCVPSGFATVAVRVAVPTVRPFTTTLVVVVKVSVGETMEAGAEIESEIGVVLVWLFPVETVAVVVAVCPTITLEIVEKVTLGVVFPGAEPPGCWGAAMGQAGGLVPHTLGVYTASKLPSKADTFKEPTAIPLTTPELTVATLVFELLHVLELVRLYWLPVSYCTTKVCCFVPPTATAKGLSATDALVNPSHVSQNPPPQVAFLML